MATFVVTSSSSTSSWSSTWTTCWNRGSSTSRSTTSYYGGGTTYESTVDGQPCRITGLSRKSINPGTSSLLWTRTSRTKLCSTMQASSRKLQHYAAPATNAGYYLIQLSFTHGFWPWPPTSRISRNYVVIFSYVHSSISTSSTTSIGYLLQPTGTQPIAVTYTSTSLVYQLPPQPNQSLQHQPKPCLQTNIPVTTNPMAHNPQGVQGQSGLLGVPGQQALQAPPLPQGSPGPQSAHGPSVCQVPQVAQGQLPTQAPQAAQDPSHSAPTQQGIPQAQTSGNQPTNLIPPDLDTLEQRLGATLQKGIESLKSALTPTPTPTPTPLAPPPSGTPPSSFSPKPSTPTPTTAPIATPVKAKPPTPPTEPHQRATSPRLNQRFPLIRERPPSRKSRSRSRRRRRSRSKEAHTRGHRDSTRNAPPAYGSKGQDHSRSKQQSAPMRHTKPTLPKSLHQEQPKMRSTQPFVDPMPFTKFIKMAGRLSTEGNTEIKNKKDAIHRDQPHQNALNCGTPKNP